MNNLDITKFDPSVEKLTEMANDVKDLTILGVDDKEGYKLVHKARIELRDTRNNIKNTGKALREEATAFSKAVITKEKELVAIIEPVEQALKKKQEEIDDEIKREKRRVLLPDRVAKLEEIDYEFTDGQDFLLEMGFDKFSAFFNDEKTRWLELKEAILHEKEEKAGREQLEKKHKEDQEKLRAKQIFELENARIEAAKKAKKEAKEQAEQDERNSIAQEAKEQAELESKKKYQMFMKKHGADVAPKGEFVTQTHEGVVTLYKKVDSIKI